MYTIFYWKNIMIINNEVYKLYDIADIPNISAIIVFYKNTHDHLYSSSHAYTNSLGELHIESKTSITPEYWCYRPTYKHNYLFDVTLIAADHEGEDINVGVFNSFPTLEQLKSYMLKYYKADVISIGELSLKLQVLSFDPDNEVRIVFMNAEFVFTINGRSFKGSIDIHTENSILTWE